MVITINKERKEVPFDLSVISLGKFIEFHEAHGRKLERELSEILSRDYFKILKSKGFSDISQEDIDLHRHMDIDLHLDKEALAWCTFWTGYDFEELIGQPSIQPVLDYYRLLKFLLKESEEDAKNLTEDIQWNGEAWSIQDFKVNPASDMTFNEIITSKEIMRQVYAIGKGKWEGLPYLCAVFLRKKDEAFSDELIYEGSERLKLMQELPMDIALRVAFFLSICVATWSKTSVSLENPEEQASQN